MGEERFGFRTRYEAASFWPDTKSTIAACKELKHQMGGGGGAGDRSNPPWLRAC